MNDDGEIIMWLALFFIGLALLLFVSLFVGIAWLVISSIAASIRYNRYLEQAGDVYDQVEIEVGADLPADEILQAVWSAGLEMNEEEAFDDELAWLEGTLFGMGVEQ